MLHPGRSQEVNDSHFPGVPGLFFLAHISKQSPIQLLVREYKYLVLCHLLSAEYLDHILDFSTF